MTKKTWFVILMLVIFWPLGIYLMWRHQKFNKIVRIVISTIFVIMTISMMFNGGMNPFIDNFWKGFEAAKNS